MWVVVVDVMVTVDQTHDMINCFQGWTRRTMVRDAWTDYGGNGWWRWWSKLGGLLAMALALSLFVASLPGASANPDAKRLYEDLLSNYNRLIRPVGNNSDRLTVKMGLRLSQLIDVVSIYFIV